MGLQAVLFETLKSVNWFFEMKKKSLISATAPKSIDVMECVFLMAYCVVAVSNRPVQVGRLLIGVYTALQVNVL